MLALLSETLIVLCGLVMVATMRGPLIALTRVDVLLSETLSLKCEKAGAGEGKQLDLWKTMPTKFIALAH
jgi:hypothetical protein